MFAFAHLWTISSLASLTYASRASQVSKCKSVISTIPISAERICYTYLGAQRPLTSTLLQTQPGFTGTATSTVTVTTTPDTVTVTSTTGTSYTIVPSPGSPPRRSFDGNHGRSLSFLAHFKQFEQAIINEVRAWPTRTEVVRKSAHCSLCEPCFPYRHALRLSIRVILPQ